MRKDVRLVESTWLLPSLWAVVLFSGQLLGSLVVALIKLKLGFSSMLKLEAFLWVCHTSYLCVCVSLMCV